MVEILGNIQQNKRTLKHQFPEYFSLEDIQTLKNEEKQTNDHITFLLNYIKDECSKQQPTIDGRTKTFLMIPLQDALKTSKNTKHRYLLFPFFFCL